MKFDEVTKRLAKISAIMPPIVRVKGVHGAIGQTVKFLVHGRTSLFGEIVASVDGELHILPYGPIEGLSNDTFCEVLDEKFSFDLGNAQPGNVIDGFGQLVFGEAARSGQERVSLTNKVPEVFDRNPIKEGLPSGIRAIDLCTPLARGQRMVILAPAGVGKSSLLKMLIDGAQADRFVLCLVGERGREAFEMVSELREKGLLDKTLMVVSTSDKSSVERAKAPELALTVADHYAKQGKSVLVMVDSITRYCRALREIALALGELPTRRGYPSSIFTSLPKLVERAGNFAHGSITLLCTVLVEDDLTPDPIAEEVQSLVDGHIWLSREMAAQGHYPAIDILKSVSRLSSAVQSEAARDVSNGVRRSLSNYKKNEILLRMGEYAWGNDKATDQDLKSAPALLKLLKQNKAEGVADSLMLNQFKQALAISS